MSQHNSKPSSKEAPGFWSNVSFEDLNLPNYIIRRLAKSVFETVSDLERSSQEELLRIYRFGKGSLEKLEEALMEVGHAPLRRYARTKTSQGSSSLH